uniref:NADH-ubiquinone oxidoreductase chain 5 n=1 Tax=Monomachus antipodalis TaxID=161211 RepID=A0A0E3IC48_9HYME|nr:NADH dehydrogenase subunit 5 [Monomachus antipodalis]
MMIYYLYSMIYMILSFKMFMLSLIFMYKNLNLFIEWNFIIINSLNMNMFILLDFMSMMFLSIVFMITSMIMIYSKEYMFYDKMNNYFIYIMNLFVLSMMIMIISPNLISILFGWDMLGLTSYCLVIFYQNNQSFNSGMLTFLSNRLGDIFLIMSISLMSMMSSWNLFFFKFDNFMFILTLILTSITKSAQFPFSPWLPAAMAAPTPISSLVHSSTLVTAGIYLLIRFNYSISQHMLTKYLLLISLITMFLSSLSANYEYDLKKIIALSTLSQLGLMMSIYSLNLQNLSFFHLLTHATFKALLFMCSGVMIHNMMNFQDIRFMGNLINMFPMTIMMFNIATLSLCGIPFMSGFYSKDLIIEYSLMMNLSFFTMMIFYLSISLTMMYSIRLIYYLILNNYLFTPYMIMNENKTMNMPMILLMFMSTILGSMINWMMFMSINFTYLNFYYKTLIFLCMIMSIIMSLFFMKMKLMMKNFIMNFFFTKMWFIPNIQKFNNYMFFMLSKSIYLYIEKSWNEFMGFNYFKSLLLNNFMNKIFINKFLIIIYFSLYFLMMIMILLI